MKYLFENSFVGAEIECFEHQFSAQAKDFVEISLIDVPFEHILVEIYNPRGDLWKVLTFKTRLTAFVFENPYSLGTWTIKIVKTYPVASKYRSEYKIQVLAGVGQKSEHAFFFSPNTTPKKTSPNLLQARWLGGDVHTHTSFSDGRMSVVDLLDISRLRGLDFLAITDHNVLTPTPDSPLTILPAVEYTPDDFGHFNIYNVQEEIDYDAIHKPQADLNDSLQKMILWAREHHCPISINHPFDEECPSSRDFFVGHVDFIEVINSPTDEAARIKNNRAVQAFDLIWNQGYKIFALGGSDAHRAVINGKVRPGTPLTRVHLSEISPEAVLGELQKGHSYLTMDESVAVKFVCGGEEVLPGAEVSQPISMELFSGQSYRWNLIKDGIVLATDEGKHVQFNDIFVPRGSYLRIEARDEHDEIIVFVNPFHNGVEIKRELRWFDVLDQIGENPRC
ncbi:MAG: CehA/McbA family metallohydrolase [Brevinema sp.]